MKKRKSKKEETNKFNRMKALALGLKLSLVVLVLYLIALPLYPEIKYLFTDSDESKKISKVAEQVEEIKKELPDLETIEVFPSEAAATSTEETNTDEESATAPSTGTAIAPQRSTGPINRLIIPKIGVNAPITKTDNANYGLSRGAWLIPVGSTPDQGGNTILTGHRFRYLPPNNLTFYLFHKLEPGDIFTIIWQGEDYYYRIKEKRITDAYDVSPHQQTGESIVTMYTCHPIYSTEKRLVVVSELISSP